MAITVEPRPYQIPPLETFYRRQNILLAFDTGVGKTYCAIAAAEKLIEDGEVDTCLLVVPAGLKWQWAEALAKFTDLPTRTKKFKGEKLTVPDQRYAAIIDGTPVQRAKQYRAARESDLCNYVIIGFDNVSSDARDVRRIKPDMAVIDEASGIKTLDAKRTIEIKDRVVCKWRMALTATPIDNRPDELFSIMEWVDPEVLGRGDLFDATYIERNYYGDVTGYKNLPTLVARLGDAMYRKSVTDPDIAPFMPDRQFMEWPVKMDGPIQRAYARMAWDLIAALDDIKRVGGKFNPGAHYAGGKKPNEATAVGRAMSIHTCMEMLLDHPDLIIDSALFYEEGKGRGSKYAYEVWTAGLIDEVSHSMKLVVLMDNLAKALANPASKVIIFTRYRGMQEMIARECQRKEWHPVSFHGTLTTAEQQEARSRFLNRPYCRVFVSTHAGERGTDLPVANWLVNYDAVWSSGQADQINGRHMRTSSTFEDIYVANMVTEGSIEERKLDQQDHKRRVAEAIIDGVMPKSGRIDNDVEGLRKHIESWLTVYDPDGMFRSVATQEA